MSAAARAHGVSPYRVALDQKHDELMAALDRKPTPPESSVTLSRNAKGVAQFEVVVRGPNISEVHAMAKNIYNMLAASCPYYPYSGGEAA